MNNTMRNPSASHWLGTDSAGIGTVIGMALMFVVFAFNIVGDGLRDALAPRLGGQL
jgi:ABC-type dipeptide/oligopeptide/nickel transport system permease subunit